MCTGIRIIAQAGIQRRERFILSVAIGLGLGVTLCPEWATNALWPEDPTMSTGLSGFRDAVIITLSTGFRCWSLFAPCVCTLW